jgi:type I restriction enzyme R subunit
MALLRDPGFQDLLMNYPRPTRTFYVAYETEDEVTSAWLIRDGDGREYKPEDYLSAFAKFVTANADKIEGIRVLLDRPRDWRSAALTDLRQKLLMAPQRFSADILQRAHEQRYHKALVDIISMVKHAVREEEPLYTAEERVNRALAKVTAGRTFTTEQQQWLDRIRVHLIENLSIEEPDFDILPVFTRAGGLGRASQVFGKDLSALIAKLNEAVAA